MKFKSIQFLFLGITAICFSLSTIMWALCFFAYSSEFGIYAFHEGTPKFEIILSILYLVFLILSFPLFFAGLFKDIKKLAIGSYFTFACGYGIGLAVAIFEHEHYNWGASDPYFISIIEIVFISIGLLSTLIMLTISLVQKIYSIKKTIINAAIVESKKDNSIETLRKYKQLLDDGIISEEEFNAQKKKILG